MVQGFYPATVIPPSGVGATIDIGFRINRQTYHAVSLISQSIDFMYMLKYGIGFSYLFFGINFCTFFSLNPNLFIFIDIVLLVGNSSSV